MEFANQTATLLFAHNMLPMTVENIGVLVLRAKGRAQVSTGIAGMLQIGIGINGSPPTEWTDVHAFGGTATWAGGYSVDLRAPVTAVPFAVTPSICARVMSDSGPVMIDGGIRNSRMTIFEVLA